MDENISNQIGNLKAIIGYLEDKDISRMMLNDLKEILQTLNSLTCNDDQEKIKEAIQKYYHTLDKREHGGIAQSSCFREIEQILDMNWVQGATLTNSQTNKKGNP